MIDWGDDSIERWIGPYPSGEEIAVNHTWEIQGIYNIQVRVKDTDNLWGPWGELEVSMPVNQPVHSPVFVFPLLQKILERFKYQCLYCFQIILVD